MTKTNGSQYFPEYLDGTLDRGLRQQLDEWLATDADARDELEALARLRDVALTTDGPEPPSSLRERFYGALEEEQAMQETTGAGGAASRRRSLLRSAGALLAAAALLAGGFGLGAFWAGRPSPSQDRQLATLTDEVQALKQQVLLSQLHHPSATERLRGVRYGLEMPHLSDEVRLTLERVVLEDENTHVRLAAAQVLFHFLDPSGSRQRLADLSVRQDDPTVQLQMVARLHRQDPLLGAALIRRLEEGEGVDPKVRRYLRELIRGSQTQPTSGAI